MNNKYHYAIIEKKHFFYTDEYVCKIIPFYTYDAAANYFKSLTGKLPEKTKMAWEDHFIPSEPIDINGDTINYIFTEYISTPPDEITQMEMDI